MNTIINSGVTFTVGQKYLHRAWGEYTVLSISRDKMVVEFESGQKELTISIAARMHFNLQCEAAKALCSNGTGKEEDIAYTIGRIAVLGKLYCCGMQDNKFSAFKARYEGATGSKIEKIKHITILCDNANKWGCEMSIALPEGFKNDDRFALPENVTVVENKDNTYTINNNKLWWHLVENLGFILGNEQNLDKIFEKIPQKMQCCFLEGTKNT